MSSGLAERQYLPTDEPRFFVDEDVNRPVLYQGKVVPFSVAKMDQWSKDIRLWAQEQVFTKDESDGLIKHFPDLDYFWDVLELVDQFGILVVPKTRRMMMTHLFLSLKFAHQLIFKKNSYNCIVTLREQTAEQHLRDRTLFTLEHLDFRFPYPRLTGRGSTGIRVSKSELFNQDNLSGVYAYPSGSGKVRGMTVTYAFYDEYAHQTHQEENWTATLPALEGKNCRGVFLSSVEPGTYMEQVSNDIPEHAPYIELRKGMTYTLNSQGACVLHLNYRADPKKDPDTPEGLEWFKKERKKYDKYKWLKEYEGRWRFPIQKRVFHGYQKDMHSMYWEENSVLPIGKPILIGLDFGYRYPCATICWENTVGQIVVYQSVMKQNITLDKFIPFVQGFLDAKFGQKWRGLDKWYIDPAGKAESGQGTARSAKRILRGLLKHTRIYHRFTYVQHRVHVINMLFEKNLIKVNPNCGVFFPEGKKSHTGTFIDMLEWGYQHKDPKEEGRHQDTEINKDGFFDHMADSFGYIIAVIYKEEIDKMKNNKIVRDKTYKGMPKDTAPWLYDPDKKKRGNKGVKKMQRYASKSSPFL